MLKKQHVCSLFLNLKLECHCHHPSQTVTHEIKQHLSSLSVGVLLKMIVLSFCCFFCFCEVG